MHLYVSNLMSHITTADLKQLFLPFGYVAAAQVIFDRLTGASRGFGFVEMPEQEEADKAMRELKGLNVGGRAISVADARECTGGRLY